MSSARPDRPVILVAIWGLGLGGAERLVVEAADSWDRERFDYRVAYVLPWKDQLVPELSRRGVPVECVGGPRGVSPLTPFRLRGLLRRWRVDLVHAHLPAMGILTRLVSPVPVVYTEHNLADSYRQPTRWLNRASYGRNRAVTTVSQAVAESITDFPGPRARLVPNGVAVDVSETEAARARAEVGASGRPLVVHVGNIRPHKGHGTLVAAARHLAQRLPDAMVVSIGGEKHPGDLERVRGDARAAGVESRLHFLGRRDDARAFLAAADVVVNPADVEGLPLVVLEALALGKPVVATAVGGVPTVVVDGVTGRLVPPREPQALADAVVELLDDPAGAGRMGAEGAALVRRSYSVEAMIDEFEKIYLEVLGG